MFCNKCGCQIDEGNAFCTNCGAPVGQGAAPTGQENTADVNQQMNNFEVKKPKKKMSKGKKVGVISVASVAGVLISSIVAMACIPAFAAWVGKAFPSVSNFIMKTFSTSDNYWEYVMDMNVDSEKIAETVVRLSESLKNGGSFNVEDQGKLKITVGDGLKDMVYEAGGYEAKAAISWVDSAALSYKASIDGDSLGYNLGLDLNDTQLVTSDVVLDMESGELYMTIPEASNQAIKIDLGEQLSAEQMKLLQEFLMLIPDEEVLERITDRYIECVLDQIEASDKKSEKITAGGVTQRVTRVTVKVSPKTLVKVATAVLQEAKTDKDIENIIKNVSGSQFVGENPDEVYREFVSGIDELLSELNGVSAPAAPAVSVYFWVNSSAEIVGVGTGVTGIAEVKCIMAEDGDRFGMLMLLDGGGKSVKFEGNGTKSNGKKSGSFDLYAADVKLINVTMENIDVNKEKEGKLDGKITVQISEDIGGLLSMMGGSDMEEFIKGAKLEISGSGDTAAVNVYMRNKLFLGLEATRTTADGSASVKKPSNYVDLGSPDSYRFEDNLERWASTTSADKLISNLQKAGAPSSLLYEMQNTQEPAYAPTATPTPFQSTGTAMQEVATGNYIPTVY